MTAKDLGLAVGSWFDNDLAAARAKSDGFDWSRFVPFLILHAGCLLVFVVGWSFTAVLAALLFTVMRATFVTAFYHRYFSHKAFRTSRPAQFVFAVLGNTAVQRGPLWWAAHHRQHHRETDREGDPHSPILRNLYWSHMGWLTDAKNFPTDRKAIPDLVRYPELRWLDRFDTLVPIALAVALWASGAWLESAAPSLGTSGGQMVVWGFFVSTTLLFHVTSLVNSGAHTFGKRRFPTQDGSRNSFLIALLTMGEGWHNNHHHYPGAARQGFYWWEFDPTYYLLKALSFTGLIWGLNPVPVSVLESGRAGHVPGARRGRPRPS
jgi:stearoyl-CoA desaturase (delta-9 desaturase)